MAYYSKTLNKAQRNYCVTRRVLLAIVRTLEYFHEYLNEQEFHLRVDHSALTLLMSFKNPEGQTTRCIERLQEYSFTSEHRQGRKHNNVGVLSLRPCQEECTHCHKVEARADVKQIQAIAAVAADGWDPAALRTEELNDQNIGPIPEEVETGERSEWKDIADRSPTYKSYWVQWNCESADGRSKIARIVLPRSRVKDVLTELHGGPSGHLGVNKTLNKVRKRYYWLKARSDIEK
jgi:hypothetical protein